MRKLALLFCVLFLGSCALWQSPEQKRAQGKLEYTQLLNEWQQYEQKKTKAPSTQLPGDTSEILPELLAQSGQLWLQNFSDSTWETYGVRSLLARLQGNLGLWSQAIAQCQWILDVDTSSMLGPSQFAQGVKDGVYLSPSQAAFQQILYLDQLRQKEWAELAGQNYKQALTLASTQNYLSKSSQLLDHWFDHVELRQNASLFFQLGLQVAELHRKSGQSQKAIEVLKSLKDKNPHGEFLGAINKLNGEILLELGTKKGGE